MTDGFDVRPADLRGAAGSFRREEGALEGHLEALRSGLSALGEPWGDDDPGRSFGSNYQPSATALLANIGVVAEGLGSIRDGLLEMAEHYRGSDGASEIPGSGP